MKKEIDFIFEKSENIEFVRAVELESGMVISCQGNLYQFVNNSLYEVEEKYIAPFEYEYIRTGKILNINQLNNINK